MKTLKLGMQVDMKNLQGSWQGTIIEIRRYNCDPMWWGYTVMMFNLEKKRALGYMLNQSCDPAHIISIPEDSSAEEAYVAYATKLQKEHEKLKLQFDEIKDQLPRWFRAGANK